MTELTKAQNIIRNLLHNDDFARTVTPFIKPEYFDNADSLVFGIFSDFFNKHNARPSIEALYIELDEKRGVPEKVHKGAKDLIEVLGTNKDSDDSKWLLETTESFCKERALYLAMSKGISIMEDPNAEKGAIPDLMSEALAVSFDTNLGHDYLSDAEKRHDFITRKVNKFDFDVDEFNRVTNGGTERKTLNIILAGTNVGKSLILCHLAAHDISKGRNVLYITLEMAEEKIAQRIDANLLNIPLQTFDELPKQIYMDKFAALRSKTAGRLFIKEYPTGGAHCGHFRHFIRELKQKKHFKADSIYIDYLGICASSRLKMSQTNSYGYSKSVAEELRGLMIEENANGWSAGQMNRSGFADSDPTLTATADSFGIPFTADFMLAAVTTSELQQLGQLKMLDLKNRYGAKSMPFVIGVDSQKMKLYNITNSKHILVPEDKTFGKTKGKFGNIKV